MGAEVVKVISNETIEKVLLEGDLSNLTTEQRLSYYQSVCHSLGLNPLTKPFDYIRLDGKLVLYAKRDCTDQLRKKHKVSIQIMDRAADGETWVVTARATFPNGRQDESIGAVDIGHVKGVARANALMKAETKAKRRVTLSICGLGLLDESEIEDIQWEAADTSQIAERNVKQAAANALRETGEAPPKEEGGEPTKDNWQDVVSHIGKAEGTLLGKRLGDLHPNVVEWLYNKWREGLGPSATEKDLRLKKAVEYAYAALQEAKRGADAAPEPPKGVSGEGEGKKEGGTGRTARLAALKGLGEDLVLTEPQLCDYIRRIGYANVAALDQLDDGQINYLLQNWDVVRKYVELETKPKPAPSAAKAKKGRKK